MQVRSLSCFFSRCNQPAELTPRSSARTGGNSPEVGEIDRFDRDKEVVSFAGLNPVIRESGDSRFEGGISKKGSGRLRWLLVQSAYVAVHRCDDDI